MTQPISRRAIAKAGVWSAPVVAASATIPSYAASVAADCTFAAHPAYNISGTDEGTKTVQSFAVPNNVHKLRFELVGGAGGTNNRMTPAGSGAKVTGVVSVTPSPPAPPCRSSLQQAVSVTAPSPPPPVVKATATAAPYPPTPSPATSPRRSTPSTRTRLTPRPRCTLHPAAAHPHCSSTASS